MTCSQHRSCAYSLGRLISLLLRSVADTSVGQTPKNECHNQAAESGVVRQRIGHTPVFQRSQYPGRWGPHCRRRIGRCVHRIQVTDTSRFWGKEIQYALLNVRFPAGLRYIQKLIVRDWHLDANFGRIIPFNSMRIKNKKEKDKTLM